MYDISVVVTDPFIDFMKMLKKNVEFYNDHVNE